MRPDTTEDGWHDQVAGECIREMMTQRPTPETDDAQFGTGRVSVDFARRLERQRDELTELVAKWRDMTPEEMRLRAGDMTAQEIRSVKAVLNAILPRANA